jgi:hypothetical protein
MDIEELLQGKTALEKANIKSDEIIKVNLKETYERDGYTINISKVEKIEGGIQVFAQAFKDGKQIGFGKDGSVDIERFKFFNPRVLIEDVNGDIERHSEETDIETGIKTTKVRKLRYDKEEALRICLLDNIKIIGKENTTIIEGKIGNTTTTFYPDAGTGGDSVDGSVAVDTTLSSPVLSGWNDIHDSPDTNGQLGGYFPSVDEPPAYNGIGNYTHPAGRIMLSRSIFLFDTSALGTDTIDSATLSAYITTVNNIDNDGNDFISVVQCDLASTNNIVAGDFDKVGDTIDDPTEGVDSGQRKDMSSISTSAFLDFTLNSTGIGWIQKSGVSQFGMREGHDIVDDPPTNFGGNDYNSIIPRFADYTGTTSDPKLVVEHTAASSSIKSINGLAQASIKSVNGLAIASVKSFNGVSNVS